MLLLVGKFLIMHLPSAYHSLQTVSYLTKSPQGSFEENQARTNALRSLTEESIAIMEITIS